MKGPDAMCPETGSPLSEQRHPDERRRPHREPTGPESALLSTGAETSSAHSLKRLFRRSLDDGRDDPPGKLLSRACYHLDTLRAACPDVRDEWIWYALAEKLHRDDLDAGWMRAYVDPVCPHCGSELAVELAPREDILPKCGVNCRDDNRYVAGDIAERVRDTYNAAFADRDCEALDAGDLQIISP